MKVMLLAAGKGTRMLPLTATTPKPLLKVGGISLIEHQIRKLKAAGFSEFVINHAWLGAQIEEALGDGCALGVNIAWSREEEPLETAGGIIRALPLLGREPFAVVNADIWTSYSFARLREAPGVGYLAHLVLVDNPPHHPAGDFGLAASGRLRKRDSTRLHYTYSGIAVFHPALFSGVPEGKCPLLPLLLKAVDANRITGEHFSGEWIDVGTPERLAELDAQLRPRDH